MIVFLNCYDPKNPKSGGAERFTLEIATRFARRGAEVHWISESVEGLPKEENYRDIHIHRYGNRLTVLFFAVKFYFKNKHDIKFLFDSFHGYPFLTALYADRSKLYTLIYEVAGEIWNYMTPFPLNIIGRILEKILISVIYRNLPFITICKSTEDELISLGINQNNISIIPLGLNMTRQADKNAIKKRYQIAYFGGLRGMKKVEDQIEAINILKDEFNEIRLIISGRKSGKYFESLQKLVEEKNLNNHVKFIGFVDQEDKEKILEQSYLTLGTSVKEGWGLGISEGAYFGTPAVAYDVGGFRDNIKHHKSGLLTYANTPEALAGSIKRLFMDDKLYEMLRENAMKEAGELSWEKAFSKFEEFISTPRDKFIKVLNTTTFL